MLLTRLLADANDLDLVQPADSPAPLDSPFGSAVSSLMVCERLIIRSRLADCVLPSPDFPTPRTTHSPCGRPTAPLRGLTMVSILCFHVLSKTTSPWKCPCHTHLGHSMLSFPVSDRPRCYPMHQTELPRLKCVCHYQYLCPWATLSLVTQSGASLVWQAQQSRLHHQHRPPQRPQHWILTIYWMQTAPRLWKHSATSSANTTQTTSHLARCSKTSYPSEIIRTTVPSAHTRSKIVSKSTSTS